MFSNLPSSSDLPLSSDLSSSSSQVDDEDDNEVCEDDVREDGAGKDAGFEDSDLFFLLSDSWQTSCSPFHVPFCLYFI